MNESPADNIPRQQIHHHPQLLFIPQPRRPYPNKPHLPTHQHLPIPPLFTSIINHQTHQRLVPIPIKAHTNQTSYIVDKIILCRIVELETEGFRMGLG